MISKTHVRDTADIHDIDHAPTPVETAEQTGPQKVSRQYHQRLVGSFPVVFHQGFEMRKILQLVDIIDLNDSEPNTIIILLRHDSIIMQITQGSISRFPINNILHRPCWMRQKILDYK
jgi:hypothetical protein